MQNQILLRQSVPLSAYKPRVYLNGFPKAGLHFLEKMVGVLVSPSTVGTGGSQWLGTYKWHSWSMIWQDLRRYLWRVSCLERGCYLMGHSAYHEDIERMFCYGNIGHIFVYRDFRDIAVSQAHHIMDEGQDIWQHAHKDVYRMMGYDEALLAVIEGMGPYPGVMERWTEYAPWLEANDVLVFRYAQLRENPNRCAGQIILYLLRKATELLEGNIFGVEMDPEDIRGLAEEMVREAEGGSTTFRKGIVGGWREEFKPEHIEAFKRTDQAGWLVKLGFEQDPDWS